ncbi:MAG: hypothetical protein WBQ36_09170, partial [Desulfobaccales bacterium]
MSFSVFAFTGNWQLVTGNFHLNERRLRPAATSIPKNIPSIISFRMTMRLGFAIASSYLFLLLPLLATGNWQLVTGNWQLVTGNFHLNERRLRPAATSIPKNIPSII